MKGLNEDKLYNLVNKISLNTFGEPFHDDIRYNYRLRTTGGRYIPSKRMIEINPKYILEMDEEDYIGIIKHELCHYHLHIKGKGYRHGDKEFKELLIATNSPRHCKPLPSNKKATHTYICTKCNFIYKRVRRVNVNRYRCGKCQNEIKEIYTD